MSDGLHIYIISVIICPLDHLCYMIGGMNAQDIRAAYLKFFSERGHVVIPRALLVPQNDPTTLFTGSGMQPLIPYLLGE